MRPDRAKASRCQGAKAGHFSRGALCGRAPARGPVRGGYTAPVSPKPPPLTPNALPVREALLRSAPLAHLQAMLWESNARLAAIAPCLPGPLASHVRAGPLDAEGWSLLASNAAVAAKLRQLAPRLQDAIAAAGWPERALRIKINAPGG